MLSSSVHTNNKKEILIPVKGLTDGLDGTEEVECSINFTEQPNRSCLSLHYNESKHLSL